jgi:hypothetical protein
VAVHRAASCFSLGTGTCGTDHVCAPKRQHAHRFQPYAGVAASHDDRPAFQAKPASGFFSGRLRSEAGLLRGAGRKRGSDGCKDPGVEQAPSLNI